MDAIIIVLYLVTIILVFIFMEFFAWFLHRFVMHGFLWVIHENHHKPKGKGFQKNDLFSVFLVLLPFSSYYGGLLSGFNIYLWIGVGISMYGIGYFIVHDILFHKRIKIKYKPKSEYVKQILKAHGIHHMRTTKKDGVNFGFLYSSKNYAKAPI